MKICLKRYNACWYYHHMHELEYTQKQYDYILKHLCFKKINKDSLLWFKSKDIKNDFMLRFKISTCWLKVIYSQCSIGYNWLNDNFGKNIFMTSIKYTDKQELKTVVNRVINIRLKICEK